MSDETTGGVEVLWEGDVTRSALRHNGQVVSRTRYLRLEQRGAGTWAIWDFPGENAEIEDEADPLAAHLAQKYRDLCAAARGLLDAVIAPAGKIETSDEQSLAWQDQCSLCNVTAGHDSDCPAGHLAALLEAP